MQQENNIDFDEIKWSKISKKKAKFFYDEAIARLGAIRENVDDITSKALGMLSFLLPVLTALTGFFVLQWGNLSTPILVISICSVILLVAILILLLLILMPRKANRAPGEPSAYLAKKYYLNNMKKIFRGNIITLHGYIVEERQTMNSRSNLLKAAIIAFVAIPLIAAFIWLVTLPCAKG